MIFVNNGKDGRLGAFRNSGYRRAVVWLRNRLNPYRTKSFGQTYDRFMNALDNSHYTFAPGKLERARATLDRDRQKGTPLTTRRVQQVFRELDTAELSPNALADANAVHAASREVGETLAKAEAALASVASSPTSASEQAEIGSSLGAAHRVLTLMQHKVADLEVSLRANGDLQSAEAGLIRSMHDRLAGQHQRIADLAAEHGLDISGSAAFAGPLETAADSNSDIRANVYDRNSMVHDSTGISEAEVHGIMPHLLSDWDPRKADHRTPNVQRGDILHAKQAFLETQHNLQARGESLTENEIEQLNAYVENSNINRFLGMHQGDASRLPGRFRTQYAGMRSGLAKLPDEQAIVYRGTTTSHATINRLRMSVGGLLSATAFLSTSVAPNFAKEFTRPDGIHNQAATECEVRYQILGRTGKNISGIPDLADGLEDPNMLVGNGEILFAPGTTFRLVAFAKHPQRDVYGMVLREEAPTAGRVGALRNLQDASSMPPNRDAVAGGLENELARLWDERAVSD